MSRLLKQQDSRPCASRNSSPFQRFRSAGSWENTRAAKAARPSGEGSPLFLDVNDVNDVNDDWTWIGLIGLIGLIGWFIWHKNGCQALTFLCLFFHFSSGASWWFHDEVGSSKAIHASRHWILGRERWAPKWRGSVDSSRFRGRISAHHSTSLKTTSNNKVSKACFKIYETRISSWYIYI